MQEIKIDFTLFDSFNLDDHLILYNKNSLHFHTFNPLASVIWQAKKEGISNQKIADEITQAFDIPRELALQDIQSISAQWTLANIEIATTEMIVEKRNPPLIKKPADWQASTSILFFFTPYTVKIAVDSQVIADKVRAIFSFMEIPKTKKVNIHLDVITKADSYLIIKDDHILEQAATENQAAHMICNQVLQLICSQNNWLLVSHAAGVSWQEHGIMFPAVGGSGKTTLTAALIKHGFDYINDDIIPVLPKTGDLLSFPVSLSIKSGSWPILQPLYPELEALEIFGTQTRSIKYLPPPAVKNHPQTYHAKHIILLNYQAGSTAQLEALPKVSALQAILEGGSLLCQPLNKQSITDLINWISRLTCHRLTYDKLDPAVMLLRQFCIKHHQA